MKETQEFIASQFAKNFGEPSLVYRFHAEANPIPDAFKENLPETLDLYIWYPDKHSDLTTFATCGMSNLAFPHSDKRGELLLALEGKPAKETEKQIAEFMANLAIFPFKNSEIYSWWFSMDLTGDVPGFPGCKALTLHPPFSEEGWALIHTDLYDIQLFNIVPLTPYEHKIKREQGVEALQNFFYDRKVNIFAPR